MVGGGVSPVGGAVERSGGVAGCSWRACCSSVWRRAQGKDPLCSTYPPLASPRHQRGWRGRALSQFSGPALGLFFRQTSRRVSARRAAPNFSGRATLHCCARLPLGAARETPQKHCQSRSSESPASLPSPCWSRRSTAGAGVSESRSRWGRQARARSACRLVLHESQRFNLSSTIELP